MSDYSDLITELSNPIRIKILYMLNKKAATLTDIAENLGDISKYLQGYFFLLFICCTY